MFGGMFLDVVIGCATVFVAIYIYGAYKNSYWKKKSVKGPEPVPIFGNFMGPILGKISIHELFRDLYSAWKHEPFVGLYQLVNPILLVNDPRLIKQILIKDFAVFADRGFPPNEDVDPLSANLLALEGHRWKELRYKLTPIFTSGKLKKMYHLLNECANTFEKYFEELVAESKIIEIKNLTAKFTTDVISSCVLGVNLDPFGSNESRLQQIGQKPFKLTFRNVVQDFTRIFAPYLYKLLKFGVTNREDTEFFMGRIAEIVANRKKNDIVRYDFIDLMIRLQEKKNGDDFKLTDELLAAQAFIFLVAGFETSSNTMSYVFYELALRQDIQDELRAEIREALKIHDGKLSYQDVKELGYLDKVFLETLRKNPPVTFLPRVSTKDYTIPDTNVQIPAGIRVFIPTLGLHYDPQYYPDPEVFDPERFSDEAIRERPHMVYLPFGEGPRHCIGARFADHQTKMGLITILKNYRVTVSPKTDVPYRVSNYPFVLSPQGGIHLNFTKVP